MSKLGNSLRQHVPANGGIAKALTILYAIWLYVVITIIVNVYNPSYNHHAVSLKDDYIILGVCVLSWIVPSIVSTLHEGIYGVLFYGSGKKQRQKFLDKMDERQTKTRQRIFTKSYAVLATLTMIAVFIGGDWFGSNLSKDGVFALGINLLIFVIALPSLVATWDKGYKSIAS